MAQSEEERRVKARSYAEKRRRDRGVRPRKYLCEKECFQCKEVFKPGASTSKFCSQKCYGLSKRGVPMQESTKEILRQQRLGSNGPNWRGGISRQYDSSVRRGVRGYKKWRKELQEKFDCCWFCESKDRLEAHHVFRMKYYIELATHPNNGVLLCHWCHKELTRIERIQERGDFAGGIRVIETEREHLLAVVDFDYFLDLLKTEQELLQDIRDRRRAEDR